MTTQVSRYQKGKTNLDFTEARDSEWQWHQLGHVQVCTSLQADNHASTPPLSFYRPDALPATQPTVSKLKAVVAYCYCVSNFFVSKVTCNFIFNSYFWVYSVEIFYVVGMTLFFWHYYVVNFVVMISLLFQTDICEVCPSPLVLSQQLTHIELERLSMIGPEEFIQSFAVEKKLSVSWSLCLQFLPTMLVRKVIK